MLQIARLAAARVQSTERLSMQVTDSEALVLAALVDKSIVAFVQEMRTYSECEDAGKSVGFQLVESRDLATACQPCGPW